MLILKFLLFVGVRLSWLFGCAYLGSLTVGLIIDLILKFKPNRIINGFFEKLFRVFHKNKKILIFLITLSILSAEVVFTFFEFIPKEYLVYLTKPALILYKFADILTIIFSMFLISHFVKMLGIKYGIDKFKYLIVSIIMGLMFFIVYILHNTYSDNFVVYFKTM